ncbi:HTH-type transcriptional regulator AcrR [Streptococcus constellatus]|uniref:HTH-type transcriptional regulator AcrR n=1 Tax=Streptococcus constellatus TaxID=76860 RepID=A0A564SKF6_STRCV|nr:TetR/AcrR family transcriptional regulator [Streptococcus constellatus]VUW95636.1 HTH-type transcriptional regulator AcrR [Streptococcus constellatus]VUX05487.1 HTH-type transcriptional regulator AcrR [Streptococcus gordonii]
MSKREEKKTATRQTLLDTADQLIAQKGYEHLSVEEITKASGIAKGTFYNYFKKKEDLIAELGRQHFRPLNDSIVELAAKYGVLKSIQIYLEKYSQIIEDSGLERLRSWLQFIMSNKKVESKWELDIKVLQDSLQQLLEQKKLKPNTPTLLLATSIMEHIYGLLLIWTMNPETRLTSRVQSYTHFELPLLLNDYITL